MSLLDIPELAEHIGSYLTIHDLTQCVRASKAWLDIFTPLLWRTFPRELPENITDESARANEEARIWSRSYPLLVADYNNSRQLRLRYRLKHESDQLLTVISRNGRWIRRLDVPFSELGKANDLAQLAPFVSPLHAPPVAHVVAITQPSSVHLLFSLDLWIHMLKQCPNIQRIRLSGYDMNSIDLTYWAGIANYGLPETIMDLNIRLTSDLQLQQSRILPILLALCPSQLQGLTINITYQFFSLGPEDNTVREQEMVTVEEGGPLPVLRAVSITSDFGDLPPSCASFLARCANLQDLHIPSLEQRWIHALEGCSHLKTLGIDFLSDNMIRPFAMALRNGLPSLDGIQVRTFETHNQPLDVAAMISACRSGWRSVCLPSLGAPAADALIEHCSTLETLSLQWAFGLTSNHMLQILSSSPRLASFVTLVEDEQYEFVRPFITGNDFIDLEPSSGTLKPWPCESTLKVFRAKIGWIPRPDITRTYYGHPMTSWTIKREAYPGEGLEIQRRVYERLARMTRLERLELGNEDRWPNANADSDMPNMSLQRNHDLRHQYSCLDMTLRSGLRMLEGLKNLRVLSVVRMETRIGVEEVQWMRQNWPKLTMIRGLSVDGEEKEAGQWLKDECPKILSVPCVRAH
ncbi:MAG: hypothetical protein JOS17DRAFT_477325 [Linnemannia elongata]|nr:MAG: hypothetical protein JOS17DRAFT_477325 [Linnemannia elongata]